MGASEHDGDRLPWLAARGRVLITAPGFDVGGEQTGMRLRRSGLIPDHAGAAGSRRPNEVAELARDAVAAIVSSDPFTADVFAASRDLRVIARLGVGTDSIDLDAATRHGVIVTTTPGLNDETCADHALALMLAATRRVVEHDASVRRGEWNRGGALTPLDLHGKHVGVVGYGRIGRAVVSRLRGFGTKIRVYDPQAHPEPDLACATLAEVLAWADVLSLHVPLTSSTAGLIGAPEFDAMKSGAILVNTSRGGVVDEGALIGALRSGKLRGAAIDVFETEPPSRPQWAQLPNVVLSPHIGGLSREAIHEMGAKCVQQVLDIFRGRAPDGIVNPEVLEGGAAGLEGRTRR